MIDPLKSNKKSWFLLSPVFWNTFFYALAFSVIAKFLVGKLIPAPSAPGFRGEQGWRATGTWYPDPYDRFALTHLEHWHDVWWDRGFPGWFVPKISGLIEKFVDYQNTETFVAVGFTLLIILWIFAPTINSTRDRCLFYYIAAGLYLACAVSNLGEVALFGHATDFLLFRKPWPWSGGIVIANFADVMWAISLLLLFFVAPAYKKRKELQSKNAADESLENRIILTD